MNKKLYREFSMASNSIDSGIIDLKKAIENELKNINIVQEEIDKELKEYQLNVSKIDDLYSDFYYYIQDKYFSDTDQISHTPLSEMLVNDIQPLYKIPAIPVNEDDERIVEQLIKERTKPRTNKGRKE
jgi:hypothetical protein